MAKTMKIYDNRKLMVALVFAVFIILRLFVDSPYYFIGGDDAKYLELAKNFPSHTLDNKQLFLLHGPIYPYAIHFLSYLFEDYKAGIIISLLSSIVTFFVLYKLIMLLTKNFRIALVALALFSLSAENIFFSNYVQKEAFMLMLFLLSIYFYLKGLVLDRKNLYIAAFFGAITALTTDHVVFLIASFIAAYVIFRNDRIKLRQAIIPVVLTIIFYSFILITRVYVYTHNDYYPTGVDGVIEKVSDFGVRQIFAPAFFPETMELVFSKSSILVNALFIFGYMFNIFPFIIPSALNRNTIGMLFSDNITSFFTIIKLTIYIAFFLLFIYGSYTLFIQLKNKKIKNNHNLFMFLMLLFFIFPVTQRITTIRMVLMATIPLYYFIAVGIDKLNFKKYLIFFIILILLLSPFYWIFNNRNLVLANGKLVEAGNAADFLNSLPGEGVISQVGYSPELNYQTNKRIITMPSDPANLDWIVEEYRISYALYGQRYWEKFSENNKGRVFNYETIKHIRENPQKFRLLKVIEEDYGSFGSDEVHVYEVVD